MINYYFWIVKNSIPIEILSIENNGFHIFTSLTIHGKQIRMLIDTGASKTTFDKKRIRNFIRQKRFRKYDEMLTAFGSKKIQGHFVCIEDLWLGKFLVKNYNAALFDLENINKIYRSIGVKQIDGILGGDLLVDYNAEINYRNKILSFTLTDAK